MELVKKKHSFVSAAVIVFLLVTSVEAQNVKFRILSGCNYAISNSRNETFLLAAEECQKVGMTLVFINTGEKANFIVTELNKTTEDGTYWIGARKSAGAAYQWGDNTAVNEYSLIKWKNQTRQEDCVVVVATSGQFHFMDSECDERNGFICSKCDVSALPWRSSDRIIIFSVAGVTVLLVIVTISMAIVASKRQRGNLISKSQETIAIDRLSPANSKPQPTNLENTYRSMDEINIHGDGVVDEFESDDSFD